MTDLCPTCATRHAPGPCAAAQSERVELAIRPLSDSARRKMPCRDCASWRPNMRYCMELCEERLPHWTGCVWWQPATPAPIPQQENRT